MEPPGGRDSRFQLGYSMNLLSGETPPEIYGGGLGRPSTSLQQLSPRHTMVSSACGTRGGIKSDVCYDDRGITPQHGMGFEASGVNDIHDESYSSLQSKKSPPSNGKKTKGRVKIKMEYIENKLRRYTTFSKRKTGIMKKAYELSTLTGTQVMLLVASETGHVYTFATRKLQPMITSEAGKALIQTCLNSPDPPVGSAGGDQRMSATGFEETELTYNISDEDSKENACNFSEVEDYDDDISEDDDEPPKKLFVSSEVSATYSNSGSQDSQKSSDSSSSESKIGTSRIEDVNKSKVSFKAVNDIEENPTIISQIHQINNALIQSNKAKAASSQTHITTSSTAATALIQSSSVPSFLSTISTISSPHILQSTSPLQLMSSPITTPMQSQVAVQLTENIKALPLIVQTEKGVGFASVSDGMILGVIQGSESKFVAMPLSAVITSVAGIATPVKTGQLSGAESSDSCSDEEMNGNDQEPLSVFVTPDHEVFSSISPPSSPIEIKCSQRQPSPSLTSGSKSSTTTTSQAPLLSPLMYQTPQGMMYATPSNGGVLLSLAQGDPNTKPQFITIPLSMVSNGQGPELELTKRK